MFEQVNKKIAEVFKVDFDNQRVDSSILSNMRHLGRITLFSRTIKKFLLNLKRGPCSHYDQLESARFKSHVNKIEKNYFPVVRHSEKVKTLSFLAEDTHFIF